jgi:NDP-sugar pyrophosphorylase family protein
MYNDAIKNTSLITVGIKDIVTPFDFGNVILKNKKVISIEEKPNLKFKILAGIYVMKPELLQYIPDNTYFGIDDLLHKFINANKEVSSYKIDDYWLDIGRIDSLDEARERFLNYED